MPRHQLIYDELLDKISDDHHISAPADGVTVPHIKTGEPVHVDNYTLAQFLILTMVDFAEQLYSWQDDMFENTDGKLRYAGNRPQILWPAECKPGLWMSAVSRMGLMLRACLHALEASGDARPRIQVPAVFNHCSVLLREEDQLTARDLYWDVVNNKREPEQQHAAVQQLQTCIGHNPFAAEPHLLLAQVYMHRRQYDAALEHATTALRLFCEWGTSWDKRLAWDAWVAFTRVVIQGAQERKWPETPFGMLNLGLVAGL